MQRRNLATKRRKPRSRFFDFLERRLLCTNELSFNLPLAVATPYGPNSVVVKDFNKDGIDDVATANAFGSSSITVLLSNGDRTFSPRVDYTANSYPSKIIAADLNNDSNWDLIAVSESADMITILLGNGDGTFKPKIDVTTADGPIFVAAGFIDGDSFLDLVVANNNANSISVFKGNGDGTFKPRVNTASSAHPRAVAIGDFNHDSINDIAVTSFSGTGSLGIFAGNGNGTFQAPTQQTVGLCYTLLAADLNHDNYPDLALALAGNSTGSLNIYINDQAGGFAAPVNYINSASQAGSIQLVDITGDGILDLATFGNTAKFFPGHDDGTFDAAQGALGNPNSAAGAVGDFNHDNIPDLVIANTHGSSINFSFGAAPGVFPYTYTSYGVGYMPLSVISAYVNDDAYLDLITANRDDDNISVFLGNGNGTFAKAGSDIPAANGPQQIVAADFNNDDIIDLATANLGGQSVSILLGNGDGTFQTHYEIAAFNQSHAALAVADFNHDGKFDIAVANDTDKNISILMGNGNGTFQTAVNYALGYKVEALLATDIDGDQRPDLLAVDSGTKALSLLLNNGNGTFQPKSDTATDAAALDLAIGDINNDGKPDAVVVGDKIQILLGNNGTFTPKQSIDSTGVSVALADIDGDSNIDLVVGNRTANTLDILLGHGDGTFSAPVQYGVRTMQDIAAGDFNRDGKTDVASTSLLYDGQPDDNLIIYTNASPLAPTQIQVSSNHPDSIYGQSVTFTATVTSGAPDFSTGFVQFVIDGKNSGAPAPLVNNVATYDISSLNVGNHAVTAIYLGDSDFSASTSQAITQHVDKAPAQISWAAPAPIVYGTPLSKNLQNATANVAGAFKYNFVPGTVLHAGDHTLSVTFTPTDANHYLPVTVSVTLTVNKATLTLTAQNLSRLVGDPNPALTYKISGLVNHDKITAITGAPALSTIADSLSPVGAYAIDIAAGTLASSDYSFNLVAGTLSVLPNQPDLILAIGPAKTSYPTYVPGDSLTFPITITNIGGVAAAASALTPLFLELHASPDADYHDGDPLLLPPIKITAPIAGGASKIVTATFKLPLDFLPGTFFATAKVDTTNALAEFDETNNDSDAALTPRSFTVDLQAGAITGRPAPVPLSFLDDDGTKITLTLAGPGNLHVVHAGGNYDLTIANTTASTSLNITTTKSKTPGDDGRFTLHTLTANAPLKTINAATTDLVGDLSINSAVTSITLNSVDGGAGSTITIAGPLNTLAIKQNFAHATLNAVSLGAVNIAGNLDSSKILLTQPVSATLKALTSLKAAQIINSEIRAPGNIGTVTTNILQDSIIFAGVLDAATTLPASAGDFINADAALLPTITSISVKGLAADPAGAAFINSLVAAGRIKTASLPKRESAIGDLDAAAAPFGFAQRIASQTYAGPLSQGDFISPLDAVI